MILLLLGCPPEPPPPEVEPEPEPTLRVLAEGDPIAMSRGRVDRSTPIYSGQPAALWEASADRVVLYALSHDTPVMPEGGLLLDTDGRSLGSFPPPRAISWDLGVLAAWSTGQTVPTLVRTEDGASMTTELTLPDGAEAAEVRLFFGESILVAGRAASGEVFWGTVTGEGEPDLSPLPLWPVGMSAEGGRVEAWSGRGVPGDEGDCVRYRLDGAQPRCLMVDGGATLESWPLSGPWTAVSAWTEGIQLYRDSQPTPWRLEPECRWNIAVTLADPPRVLAECHPDRESPDRLRRLWSPEWERSWTRQLPPAERGSFLTRPAQHPVLAEPIPGTTPALSEFWIDLEAGERWQSPLLTPLSYDGLPRPGLGRSPHSGQLALLDFASGVWHPIEGAGEDCPTELVEIGRDHGLVLLTCQSRPNPGLYQFIHLWSVVLDLENRRAWKLDQHPEAILSPTSVLVSDRTQTQAEGFSGFEILNRLDLR